MGLQWGGSGVGEKGKERKQREIRKKGNEAGRDWGWKECRGRKKVAQSRHKWWSWASAIFTIVSYLDPTLSWGKGSGKMQILGASLVMPSQQSWFWISEWLCLYHVVLFHWLAQRLYDVVLLHCLVQNRNCWLGTTKKELNGHQTLFLVRGWGLGTRLYLPLHCSESGCVWQSRSGPQQNSTSSSPQWVPWE